MTDPIRLKMQYLGAVQLIVQKHNSLNSQLRMRGEQMDDDSLSTMEMVAQDFNATSEVFNMYIQSDGSAIIVERDNDE